MFKILVLIFFQPFSVFCLGQAKIKGRIIHSETKEGLAFVFIGIQDSKYAAISDENGYYELELKRKNKNVNFELTGFESNIKAQEELVENSIIKLIPQKEINDYDEDVVLEFGDSIILGKFDRSGTIKFDRRKNYSLGFGVAHKGAEVGVVLKNKDKVLIKNVNIVINHLAGDSIVHRINLYEFKNKKAGKQLLSKDIYLRTFNKLGTKTIDIQDQNIVIKGDILVCLEWVKSNNDYKGNEIIFQGVKTKKIKITCIRDNKNQKFRPFKFKGIKPCIYLNGIIVK